MNKYESSAPKSSIVFDAQSYLESLQREPNKKTEQQERLLQIINRLNLVQNNERCQTSIKDKIAEFKNKLSLLSSFSPKLGDDQSQTEWKNKIQLAIETAKQLNGYLNDTEKKNLISAISQISNMPSLLLKMEEINTEIQLLDDRSVKEIVDALFKRAGEIICSVGKIVEYKSASQLLCFISLDVNKIRSLLNSIRNRFPGNQFAELIHDRIPLFYKQCALDLVNKFIGAKYGLQSTMTYSEQLSNINAMELIVKGSGEEFNVTWTEEDSLVKPVELHIYGMNREGKWEKHDMCVIPMKSVFQSGFDLKARLLVDRGIAPDKSEARIMQNESEGIGIIIEKRVAVQDKIKYKDVALGDFEFLDQNLIEQIEIVNKEFQKKLDEGEPVEIPYAIRFVDIPETVVPQLQEGRIQQPVDQRQIFIQSMKDTYFKDQNFNAGQIGALIDSISNLSQALQNQTAGVVQSKRAYNYPSAGEVFDRMLTTLVHQRYDKTAEGIDNYGSDEESTFSYLYGDERAFPKTRGDNIAAHLKFYTDLMKNVTEEQVMMGRILGLQDKLMDIEMMSDLPVLSDEAQELLLLPSDPNSPFSNKPKELLEALIKYLSSKLGEEEIRIVMEKFEMLAIAEQVAIELSSQQNTLLDQEDFHNLSQKALDLFNDYRVWTQEASLNLAGLFSPDNPNQKNVFETFMNVLSWTVKSDIHDPAMLEFLQTAKGKQILRDVARATLNNIMMQKTWEWRAPPWEKRVFKI